MDDPCDSPAELDDPEVDGHERSRDERAERLEGENVPARRLRDARVMASPTNPAAIAGSTSA